MSRDPIGSNNKNSFSLNIIYSHSNDHSYGIAKSLIIAVANNCKLGVGGSLVVGNNVSLPRDIFTKN